MGKKAAPAKKAVKKAPVKKAPVKKAPVKKAPVKKAPVKKAAPKAAPAKKAPAKKAPAKVPAKAPAKSEVKQAAPPKEAAKKAAPKAAAPPKPPKKLLPPKPKRPVVREDESPWTAAELREVRAALDAEVLRLLEEIATAEEGLADLIRDSGDGAGDDQADAGSKTFEREHEMSLANNARDMLQQVQHALARIDDGSYGACEHCGKPVGKLRLQAFPRATLCRACKEAEER